MTARRSHGEGSGYLDKASGRWVAEISNGYNGNGQRRRIKRKTRAKTKANRKLRELNAKSTTASPPAKPT